MHFPNHQPRLKTLNTVLETLSLRSSISKTKPIFAQKGMKIQQLSALQALLDTSKSIVVIPHQNPDGDALGSCLAWASFLQQKGHRVHVISPNDYPDFLTWMPGQEAIVQHSQSAAKAAQYIEAAELIFTLDFNDLLRIDALGPLVEKSTAPIVMIDHHQNPKDYAALTLSFPHMGSTAEIVYHIINQWDANAIDPDMASCLYTGIMTDTGSFRFPSTTPDTHRAIAHLMECGAPHSDIHQNIHDSYTFDRVRLLGMGLTNLTKLNEIPAVFLSLSQQELNACNYQKGDTEGFVNYGLRLKDIQLAVIMIENQREGKIKMSFRSKGAFPAHTFAETFFSGGGHKNAAGGVSFSSLEETKEQLIKAIQQWKNHFE